VIHNSPPISVGHPLQSNLNKPITDTSVRINKKVIRQALNKVKDVPYNEDQLQSALSIYLNTLADTHNFLWMHIPNGGSRILREAVKLKRMGVKPGAPDILILAQGKTIFIELKTMKGVWGKEQQDFCANSLRLGHAYHLVRGRLPQDINQAVYRILQDEMVVR